MKFFINKMILWLKTGEPREIELKNNMVNVITGNSKTGKTAVLEIIDYCFCGSDSNISYRHIGENVLWYGLNFCINGKDFTIARGERKNNSPSNDYYFSGIGEIPKLPIPSIGESDLKTILEQEFKISEKVAFSHGGKTVKGNSKISYRYFLMFNTLSGNIITHSDTYFDKQSVERYREALPRIFDLATGITTLENIVISDKIEALEKDLSKLEREKMQELQGQENKKAELMLLIKRAKEARIINVMSDGYEEDLENLKEAITKGNLSLVDFEDENLLEELKKERQNIIIRIKKLKRFSKRYAAYKKYLSREESSLKPILYIKKYVENIENDEYKQFLNLLEKEYYQIREVIKTKMPFEIDVEDKVDKLESELQEIERKIDLCPEINYIPIGDRARYMAIGEIKSDFLRLINEPETRSQIDEKISLKEKELESLKDKYVSLEEKRLNMIEALNDYIQTYINISKEAFEEYGEYLSAFNYKKKTLEMRQNKASFTEKLTSSSDHLFMHMCLFLGMHEMILENEVPYVPSFLILDQPSRPYFNNKRYDLTKSKEFINKKDDWNKVVQIFVLLNAFIDNIRKNEDEFQIVVLEHVSVDAWEDCEHVNLVEVFDGIENALIPPSIANINDDPEEE